MSADALNRVVAIITEERPELLATLTLLEIEERTSDFVAHLLALGRQREAEASGGE